LGNGVGCGLALALALAPGAGTYKLGVTRDSIHSFMPKQNEFSPRRGIELTGGDTSHYTIAELMKKAKPGHLFLQYLTPELCTQNP